MSANWRPVLGQQEKSCSFFSFCPPAHFQPFPPQSRTDDAIECSEFVTAPVHYDEYEGDRLDRLSLGISINSKASQLRSSADDAELAWCGLRADLNLDASGSFFLCCFLDRDRQLYWTSGYAPVC